MDDREAMMEMILPLLVTEAMQKLEDEGKHPNEDFTEKLRGALLQIVPEHPNIEEDVWDPEKKKEILEKLCSLIDL